MCYSTPVPHHWLPLAVRGMEIVQNHVIQWSKCALTWWTEKGNMAWGCYFLLYSRVVPDMCSAVMFSATPESVFDLVLLAKVVICAAEPNFIYLFRFIKVKGLCQKSCRNESYVSSFVHALSIQLCFCGTVQ